MDIANRIMLVCLTLGILIFTMFFIDFYYRLKDELKEIKDNQFDAEQVMEIINQKYHRPIITQDRADIKELVFEDRIPWEVYKRMGTDEELHAKLLEQISKHYADMIIPYIDIAITSDYFRNDEVVKARLRVVTK